MALTHTAVKPIILTLQWSEGLKPSELTNFESEARRLRYQALGRACRQYGVQSLLLAHHADDQAETILTRLVRGHRAIGLQVMRPSAEIPECWGIHGMHRKVEFNKSKHNLLNESTKVPQAGLLQDKPINVESDGIRVYRPLLHFTKADLIATCQVNGITWVEDESNHDPTITIRNAARKILATNHLPIALRKPSLLKLASKAQDWMERRQWCADCLLWSTEFLSLDFRTGKLSVHIPNPTTYLSWYGKKAPIGEVRMKMYHRLEVGMYLRRLMEIVSPLETIPLTSIHTAIDVIINSKKNPHVFTASGVKFMRSSEKRSTDYFYRKWETYNQHTSEERKAVARKMLDGGQSYVWTLTRSPFYSTRPLPIIPVPPLSTMASTQTIPFQLWDGRFWIQIRTQLPGLYIRPFREADIKSFKQALELSERSAFEILIRDAAPDDSRWTLPAIALDDEQPIEEGESRVLALPSLDVCLRKCKGKLNYAVRYNKVDLNLVLKPEGKVFMESLDRYVDFS